MTMSLRPQIWLSLLLSLVALVSCRSSSDDATHEPLHRSVDPLIGTDWVGNTFPGASLPWGMVQLSPDNGLPGWDRIAGYYYPDSTIAGFSHTHLSGTGAGDLYDISFLPTVGKPLVDSLPLGLHARFSHAREEAHAGYYSVVLEPYEIRVELTATERCGLQAYTFAEASDSACIVLNLHKAMNWDRTLASSLSFSESNTLILGHRYSDGWARGQRTYFATRLSRAPERIEIDSIPLAEVKSQRVYGHIARLYYSVQAGERITLATALSGVDEEGARANLMAEIDTLDFDLYRQRAERAWDERLASIRIHGATPREQRTFYTALYHSLLCPTIYSDRDGRYRGPDGQIHRTEASGKHYSTFSLWDTYRSTHPLYTLIAPEEVRDMVRSLIDFGHQNAGHLPVWNMHASETDMMIGYHSVPVIVEAILKGIYQPSPAEAERLTALMRSTAERQGYRGLDEYRERGYISADREEESLSKTLEYAYDDAAIAAWGRHVGDSLLVWDYAARAQSYRQLWDASTGFFRPRLASGAWLEPFDPFDYSKHITESNAWQYLMSVQHDPEGLCELMGGPEGLGRRLDAFFSAETPRHIELPIFSTGMIGQYAHGNEPGHHVLWLYNVAREPWKATDLLRRILGELYTDRPDGICGNEDCGQMSAWYVFASMGLYPLDPVSLRYELSSPLFTRSKIALGEGKSFVIEAPDLSAERRYIKRVLLNGQPINRSFVTHDEVRRGGKLTYEMTSESGHCWY